MCSLFALFWFPLLQKHRKEISDLEQQLREKGKENKRLKENFETLKLANDTLRKEVKLSVTKSY